MDALSGYLIGLIVAFGLVTWDAAGGNWKKFWKSFFK